VILNVNSALAALPRSYEEASLSLGASPITSLWLVTIPLIWRGIAAGAIFAFVISFDEVVIAMFLSSIDTTTLPKKMLDGIFFDLSPILAAISAVLIIFNIALALLGLALANKTRKRNA
jgi:putative spermidine/putrescine transport system permease protein